FSIPSSPFFLPPSPPLFSFSFSFLPSSPLPLSSFLSPPSPFFPSSLPPPPSLLFLSFLLLLSLFSSSPFSFPLLSPFFSF
ncbi:hypothetical protein ACXWR7_12580, partial [Streptococcus pyogenes]